MQDCVNIALLHIGAVRHVAMTANASIRINRSRLAFSECAGGPSS